MIPPNSGRRTDGVPNFGVSVALGATMAPNFGGGRDGGREGMAAMSCRVRR
jgi:hypothetical protein